jgi:hypothetical protein
MVSTSRPSPRLDGYLVPGVSPAAFVAGLTFSCIDTGRPPAACPLHPFAHLAPTRLRPPPSAARDPHAHLDAIETQKKTPPKRGLRDAPLTRQRSRLTSTSSSSSRLMSLSLHTAMSDPAVHVPAVAVSSVCQTEPSSRTMTSPSLRTDTITRSPNIEKV